MDTRFNLGVEEKKVFKFFVDWVEVVKGRDILNMVMTLVCIKDDIFPEWVVKWRSVTKLIK